MIHSEFTCEDKAQCGRKIVLMEGSGGGMEAVCFGNYPKGTTIHSRAAGLQPLCTVTRGLEEDRRW